MLTPHKEPDMLTGMKLLSLFILVSILFTLFLPLASASSCSGTRKTAAILTLDVCHCSDRGAFGTVELPFIYETQPELALLGSSYGQEAILYLSHMSLLTFQIERPPRIQP